MSITPDSPTTIVLLDPTSADGEGAIELLDDRDEHVTLVVLLSGRASHALRQYALIEDLDLATAGWLYLDQATERLGAAAPQVRHIEQVIATGPSTMDELGHIIATRHVRRVLVPASVDVRTRRWLDRSGLPADIADPVTAG